MKPPPSRLSIIPSKQPRREKRRIRLSHRNQAKNGVDDGNRTHDRRYHKPELYQLSYIHHKNRSDNGTPGRIRTCDLRLRRPLLYPAELRAHYTCHTLEYLPIARDDKPLIHKANPNCVRDQIWSGWRDLNPRPSAPKADALPGCATPRVVQGVHDTHAPRTRQSGASSIQPDRDNKSSTWKYNNASQPQTDGLAALRQLTACHQGVRQYSRRPVNERLLTGGRG